MVLTVDLVPGSDALWPLSEGRVVDPDAPHGTRGDLEAELVRQGDDRLEAPGQRAAHDADERQVGEPAGQRMTYDR